jgi:hypothetical protein
MYKIITTILITTLIYTTINAQSIPSENENIPYLVTFGKEANTSYGDDDHNQIFFLIIPKIYSKPFFLRIFDPEISGDNDEIINTNNTATTFTLYGGKCYSEKDNENKDPEGNYKMGNKLYAKTFTNQSNYNNNYYTFGPVNPQQGQYIKELQGYVFKVIAEGIKGDDGNLYKYYISQVPDKNIPIDGANAFTFEYSFRLPDKARSISHIYAYVDIQTIAVKQYNFDMDDEVYIKMTTMSIPGIKVPTSSDNNWSSSIHKLSEKDKNSSIDFQLIKLKASNNNNVVFYVQNQYDKYLKFFAIPMGAIPHKKIIVRPSK